MKLHISRDDIYGIFLGKNHRLTRKKNIYKFEDDFLGSLIFSQYLISFRFSRFDIIITEINTNIFNGSKIFLIEFLHYNNGHY